MNIKRLLCAVLSVGLAGMAFSQDAEGPRSMRRSRRRVSVPAEPDVAALADLRPDAETAFRFSLEMDHASQLNYPALAESMVRDYGWTPEEVRALEKIVELQEFYLMKNDTEQIFRLDTDFHKIIYDASRSRPLRFMLSNFHNYIKKARDISVQAAGRAEKTVAEHRAILDAIREGKGELAERLTAEHIMNAERNLFAET